MVIDSQQGYIVTNAHVVKSADEISTGLSDGRTLEATLIGTDPEVDLALLQVQAELAIEYADSARLRVGDFVPSATPLASIKPLPRVSSAPWDAVAWALRAMRTLFKQTLPLTLATLVAPSGPSRAASGY